MVKKDRRQGKPDKRPQGAAERRKAERRRGPRLAVSIWVEEQKDEDLYFHQAGNLSLGGVFFERTIPHPIGTRVKLRFELPDNRGVVETSGEVVSTPTDPTGLGAGIKFVDLNPVEERQIREYIEALAREE